jgi:hypothetical protein
MKANNLMTLTALCILSLQLTTFSTAAMAKEKKGGMDGGGGGVYKISEGEYKTLPEFGILIGDESNPVLGKRYYNYYKISEKTKEELSKIISKLQYVLPGNLLNMYEVLGDRDTYIVRNNVDEAQYSKIKTEYRSTLNSYGYELDDDKFVLPAYSLGTQKEWKKQTKTYILPDFDLLSEKQQALILIHEYNIRQGTKRFESREDALVKALSVDVQVNKIINEKDLLNYNPLVAIKRFKEAGLISDDGGTKIMLLQLQRKLKRPILWTELISNYNAQETEVDPSLVQELQDSAKLNVNYAELFDGVTFKSSSRFYVYQNHTNASKNALKILPDGLDEVTEVCAKFGKEELPSFVYITENSKEIFAFRCYKKGFASIPGEVKQFLIKEQSDILK